MSNGEQNDLMKQLQATSFAIDDIRLFLDTHPFDAEALNFYQIYKIKRDAMLNEYEKNFGPILSYNVKEDNHWTWIDDPWPWEGEI